MGLQFKEKYDDLDKLKTLRYGKLMIMTDQDQDGSHIKGLLINFIHHFWPSLLRRNVVNEFITPIVKVKYLKLDDWNFNSLKYSKPCVKWSVDKTKMAMTNGSLMQVKSIAECSPWSIMQHC